MKSIFGIDYQNFVLNLYNNIGPVSVVLIILAIALIGGFSISRLCKIAKIPYVTGYIILGIILGPSVLSVIPEYMLTGISNGETLVDGNMINFSFAGLSFVGDLCMGFIAYSIGKFFKFEKLKKAGGKTLIVTILTSIAVGVVVGGLTYLVYGVIFNEPYNLAPAFIIGTTAIAISPTATSSIIRQYRAKGSYVEKLFLIILCADVIAILAFTIIIGVVASTDVGTSLNGWEVLWSASKPFLYTIGLMFVGVFFGWILSLLNNYKRTNDSRIILVIGFIAIIVALCSLAKISALLPCMAFGIFYYNFAKSEALFLQLDGFLPPILCLFFVVSGAKLNFSYFTHASVLIIAIVFCISRTGTRILCVKGFGGIADFSRKDKKYLPLSTMTITSVAVGLLNMATIICANMSEATLEMIDYCYAIILTASVILEIIGPMLAKIALIKTGSVDPATLIPPSNPNKYQPSKINESK